MEKQKFIDKMMKYEFIDKSLYFPAEKILVIADLHIGYEEALNEQGIFLPRSQFKRIMEDLKKIFLKIGKVNEIIILGDLKHEFGMISGQEWGESLAVLDFLEKMGKIILVKGNHDKILEPIARKKKIEIKDFYMRNIDGKKTCFMHGNKIFPECLDKKIKRIVLGHKHPAITIREGVKAETYKCFLAGKWKGKEIIILPSFFPLIEGSDIFIEDTNLAFKIDFRNFNVFVLGEKIYDFGKVRDAGRLS